VGHREIKIPAHLVASVETDTIRLNVTRGVVGDLPHDGLHRHPDEGPAVAASRQPHADTS